MDKTIKPLKIYICYGHEIGVQDESGNELYPEPNNESVVLKIKKYLENQGHDVWIDKEKIRRGDDWHGRLIEIIKMADVVLFCITHNAMRPNGSWKDEIAITMGACGSNMISVNLETVHDFGCPTYPLNINLFTEFQDWRLHWTAESIDEAWFGKTLKSLAVSFEKVAQCSFDMRELKKLLKPWDMSYRLRRLDRGIQYLFNENTQDWERKIVRKFCGRESLFKMFEEKIMKGGNAVRLSSDRVLWLKKGPGFGKSRFAAELYYRYAYVFSAAYFIEYNQRESHDPHTFISSVAYQLAQTNSSYRKRLVNYLNENQDTIDLQTGDPQTLFKSLIVDLLANEINGGRATQWILVDALDEATENHRNEIASLISENLDNLPSWLCFFITSRDCDDAVNRNLACITPIEFLDEENDNDLREYIQSEIEGMGLSVSDDIVNYILDESNGSFLYPEMVFRDLKNKSITLNDIRDTPKGVIGYIHSQFERLFGSNIKLYKQEIRPMLGYILTSFEPIPRAVLKYCLGIRWDSELDDLLEQLGTFFVQSGIKDEDTIAPFNKSVIDFCFDRNISIDYYVNPDQANENFAKKGLELYKSGALQWTTRSVEEPDTVQRYFLNWLPSHLINANMTKEATFVLSDFAFLMKRLRFGSVERVLQDYISLRDKLSRISPGCDAYFDVICSNAHLLRRDCEDNRAYKIMLQIASEIADECPVTQAAQRWLNPEEGDSPCDWFWLNKVSRSKEYFLNPCKLVIENAGNNANSEEFSAVNEGTIDNNNLCQGETGNDLDGNTVTAAGSIVLRFDDFLTWGIDNVLRLWSRDGTYKAVLEGHKDHIEGVIELHSGDILSWSRDNDLRLWSPDGTCKAVLEGHKDHIECVIELRSRDILSWSRDNDLRLWSPYGDCKVLKGFTDRIQGVIELRSGSILSWGESENVLRLWSLDGTCKAVLEGHTDRIIGALELRLDDILSWSLDNNLRLWSHDGTCKAVLEGHTDRIKGAMELNSGDILSWSKDNTMRYWSPNATGISIRDGHTQNVEDVIEISTGEILSRDIGRTIRIWSQDGKCKEEIKTDNPQYRTFESHFSNQATNRSHNPFSVKLSNWGIELLYNLNPVARWNCPSCHYRFIGDRRICVWYGRDIEFLQLNYGNRMSITFEQAQQRLLTDNRNN